MRIVLCQSMEVFLVGPAKWPWLALLLGLALQNGGVRTWADGPDRSGPPALGAPPPLRTPPLQHFKLSNGLPVLLMEKHEVPVVQIVLQIGTGSVVDPEGKTGLASLTFALLTEGAGQHTALELADEVDFLGASLFSGAGLHSSHLFLHVPVARLEPALQLLADVAQRPTFPPEELERQRRRRLTSLAQAHDEPTAVAAVAFSKLIFGAEHPYGRMSSGDEASLRSFTADDCRRFYAAQVTPGNATFIVVGDVKPDQVLAQLEKAFGKWAGAPPPTRPAWPKTSQVKERGLVLINKPGAAQSVIRIGRLGPPRLTEDYYALTILNTILGGSFTSRLNQNLREQHGYSYGAGSRFDFRPEPGPFVASSSVQTEVTDKALTEFLKEFRGIMGDIPDTELQRAKNFIGFSYPGEFQTTGQIAGELGELVEYHLPDTYFNEYIQKILSVTKAEVEAAAKKYLDPDRIAIVVVGDREKIEAGLQKLDLGTVRRMEIDQVLGPIPQLPEARP